MLAAELSHALPSAQPTREHPWPNRRRLGLIDWVKPSPRGRRAAGNRLTGRLDNGAPRVERHRQNMLREGER